MDEARDLDQRSHAMGKACHTSAAFGWSYVALVFLRSLILVFVFTLRNQKGWRLLIPGPSRGVLAGLPHTIYIGFQTGHPDRRLLIRFVGSWYGPL